ncbi:hypothetical protein ADEAN_000378200 [Angomonas deanei]|uniref:Uncharacterized protein n=1 Tax=Angomonas deanei TaxID=59799 RepID=A0A7G2C926_9TRYP|nr:hypothetical protein ADEAN_000378200 [Angomonas deanei]
MKERNIRTLIANLEAYHEDLKNKISVKEKELAALIPRLTGSREGERQGESGSGVRRLSIARLTPKSAEDLGATDSVALPLTRESKKFTHSDASAAVPLERVMQRFTLLQKHDLQIQKQFTTAVSLASRGSLRTDGSERLSAKRTRPSFGTSLDTISPIEKVNSLSDVSPEDDTVDNLQSRRVRFSSRSPQVALVSVDRCDGRDPPPLPVPSSHTSGTSPEELIHSLHTLKTSLLQNITNSTCSSCSSDGAATPTREEVPLGQNPASVQTDHSDALSPVYLRRRPQTKQDPNRSNAVSLVDGSVSRCTNNPFASLEKSNGFAVKRQRGVAEYSNNGGLPPDDVHCVKSNTMGIVLACGRTQFF